MRRLGAIALVCVGIMVMASMGYPLQWALALSSTSGWGTLPVALSWIPIVAAIAVGLGLILARHALAARWFDDSDSAIDTDPGTLLRLGLLVVGVVLIARGIPALIAGVTSGLVTSFGGPDGGFRPHEVWRWSRTLTASAGPAAQLVAGALLLASSTRLADRLWGPRGQVDPDDPSA